MKTFVGTSPNSLHIQIWTALIARLLLKYRQLRARFGWSLSKLTALLRRQLFVYRDLFAWIGEPGVIAGVLTYSLALPEAEAYDAVGGVFRPKCKEGQ